MKRKSDKKEKKKSAKKNGELTYFLDHPDIKREECVGNGSSPSEAPAMRSEASSAKPSIATQIGWPGTKK